MRRAVALILTLLLALPAMAQTADDAAANRLFVEAVQLWNRTEGEPVADRAATLQRVQSNLKTIIDRHAGSALAVRLVIGETVGPLSLAGVERELKLASDARAIAAANLTAGLGRILRDCPDCPELVVVPAGRFTMGTAPGEEEAEKVPESFRGFSAPQTEIAILAPLAIGRYEVTRGEFGRFVAETGHETGTACWTVENGEAEERAGRSWRSPGFAQTDRDPVICVSFEDAQAYVSWLSRKTGKAYRLPSEAEWEYAARAGTTTRRYWGDGAEEGCVYANAADATARRAVAGITWGTQCDDGHGYTAPVGSFRANAFGLHDMLGNVWEWTADCWNDSHAGAPGGGTARTSGDCSRRVLRGGSWGYYPGSARSAFRFRSTAVYRFVFNGFRVARTL